MKKAIVVFSGGIDSISMCAYLKEKYELYGISFLYGQKANQEIKKAKESGFYNAISAGGNVDALIELIIRTFDKKNGKLIYKMENPFYKSIFQFSLS